MAGICVSLTTICSDKLHELKALIDGPLEGNNEMLVPGGLRGPFDDLERQFGLAFLGAWGKTKTWGPELGLTARMLNG
jgi:hypothetical protein